MMGEPVRCPSCRRSKRGEIYCTICVCRGLITRSNAAADAQLARSAEEAYGEHKSLLAATTRTGELQEEDLSQRLSQITAQASEPLRDLLARLATASRALEELRARLQEQLVARAEPEKLATRVAVLETRIAEQQQVAVLLREKNKALMARLQPSRMTQSLSRCSHVRQASMLLPLMRAAAPTSLADRLMQERQHAVHSLVSRFAFSRTHILGWPLPHDILESLTTHTRETLESLHILNTFLRGLSHILAAALPSAVPLHAHERRLRDESGELVVPPPEAAVREVAASVVDTIVSLAYADGFDVRACMSASDNLTSRALDVLVLFVTRNPALGRGHPLPNELRGAIEALSDGDETFEMLSGAEDT